MLCLDAVAREKYVSYCLERGDAPIKPEFLASNRADQPVSYPPLKKALNLPETEQSSDEVNSVPLCGKRASNTSSIVTQVTADDSQQRDTKRMRGQNKDRRSNLEVIAAANAQQLCNVIASTDDRCPYEDACRLSHDKTLFLQHKAPDLEGDCVHFTKRGGICPYGLNCRFSACHVKDQYNVNAEGHRVTTAMLKELPSTSINDLSSDLRVALRKRTYTFPVIEEKNKLANPLLRTDALASSAPAEPLLGGGLITSDQSVDAAAELQNKTTTLFRSQKLLLAPLTTLGHLPFRRVCVNLGADVTMTEMALASSILQGRPSELTLLKRHPTEKYFGVQLASGQPRILEKCCSLINKEVECDFVDLNIACPLEPLHKKLAGSILMTRPSLLRQLARSMRSAVKSLPITMKMRMSYDDKWNAHSLIPQLEQEGINAFFVHGRTSRQRYTKVANWDYLKECKAAALQAAVIGNGDVMCYDDYISCQESSKCDNILIGRAALIKPWVFTELKEKRIWDISATERLDMFRIFVNYGLEHWGSDARGVEMTRRYFLELCSFTHRYIPPALLERLPQRVNWRPPAFVGRSDLETLLGSPNVNSWITLSEMLLGPVPDHFKFVPKHKSNAYETTFNEVA